MAIKKITTTVYKDDETQQEYQFEPIDDTIELKPKVSSLLTDAGFELRYLTRDESPQSPDELENADCFLVHYHRDFFIENDICPKDVLGYIYTRNADAYDKDGAEQVEKDYFVFAVSAYIHSGVSLSLQQGNFHPFDGQGWDTSHVGAVLVKQKEFSFPNGHRINTFKDDARGRAAGLVETWNQYLSGDVYCIVCEKLGKDKQGIDFDIVGGYYGLDYAKEALKTEI